MEVSHEVEALKQADISSAATTSLVAKFQTGLLAALAKKTGGIELLNENEIHVELQSSDSIPEACSYLKQEFQARLAMMICSDERQLGRGFVLRYVFEAKAEARNVFIFVTSELVESRNEKEEKDGNNSDVKHIISFPSIVLQIPSAVLYEREVNDMFGLLPAGNPDTRPLVLHEQWPAEAFPLRKEFDLGTKVKRTLQREYKFTNIEGDGICEIPVGPVHAGIIEPGHFRFSIQGENILNLETRLYYTHKGIEKLAENMKLDQVLLLSERISGDESVANSLAYCQALERIGRLQVPERAVLIRTLCAEMERVYNHIGTLAGMSTDVGFAYGAARLNILKERMMSLNEQVTGSRLLFGINRIGGVGTDLSKDTARLLYISLKTILDDFNLVISHLRTKSSVIDRLRYTGIISRQVAIDLGLVGVAARCAGIDVDTRLDNPYSAYPMLKVDSHHDSPQHSTQYSVEMQKRVGDALSRFDVRVEEVNDSIRIIRDLVTRLLDDGSKSLAAPRPSSFEPYSHALGYAESHRGQTLHWVMVGSDGNSLYRYKVRTASFVNWPAIEQAVLNDIVPDFPLVNKSLDLSYSGNDL